MGKYMDILYLDVNCLEDQSVFEEKLNEMSSQRREKILSYKSESDRRLSLGAGILLDEMLKKIGYRESKLKCLVNEYGKPYYKELPDFYFNLSHSGHYAVAVSSDKEVGIDIEEKKENKMRLGIARRFFHPVECELLENIKNKKQQMEIFYQIWTLKESFVKAVGRGMNISFHSFCVLPQEGRKKEWMSIVTEQMGRVYFMSCDEIEGYWVSVCSKKKERVKGKEVFVGKKA